MANPFKEKSMTGQERADARYQFPVNKMPNEPLVEAARKNTREIDGPEEVFTAAPPRQISNFGNVRK